MKYPLIISLFLAVLLFLIGAPLVSFAAEIKGLGTYQLFENEEVQGNVYVAAGDINVQGKIFGDLVGMGGNVIQEGVIEGDATFLGGNVYASSTIKGDVRIIGGTVKIGGIIDGDLVAAGATVEILPHTLITGDIIVLGGQAIINSEVGKKLKVISGETIVNGEIKGQAEITSPTVVFGSQAKIVGEVSYFSHKMARVETGAEGIDRISFNKIQWIKDTSSIKKITVSFVNFWLVLQFVNTLLLCFLLLFVFKPFSQQIAQNGAIFFGKNIVVGFASLIFLPVLAVIFVASLFALPLGILLMLLFVFVYVVSSAYAVMIVGIFIKRYILRKHDDEITFQLAAIGAVILAVLHFVPYVGYALRTIFFLATIGVLYRQLYSLIRS